MSRVAAPAPEVHDRNQISGTIADVSILAQDFFSAVAPSRMVKGQAIEPSDPVPNSADRSGIDISSRQEARDATDVSLIWHSYTYQLQLIGWLSERFITFTWNNFYMHSAILTKNRVCIIV